MKRNESILVYGVAGLLVLILAVAVVFGNERDAANAKRSDVEEVAQAPQPSATATDDGALSLDELFAKIENPAGQLARETPDGTALPVAVPQTSPESGPVDPNGPEGGADPNTPPVAVQQPLEKRAAAEVLATLGEWRRDGNYRVVKVRRGDSLSVLVQRWCGDLAHLEIAEALNEEINPQLLRQGQEIYLPWVENAVLVDRIDERTAVDAKVANEKSRTYVVKDGDMLWSLAVTATGSQAQAPKYIERLMQLNPDLVPERLRPGQKIVLPEQ